MIEHDCILILASRIGNRMMNKYLLNNKTIINIKLYVIVKINKGIDKLS